LKSQTNKRASRGVYKKPARKSKEKNRAKKTAGGPQKAERKRASQLVLRKKQTKKEKKWVKPAAAHSNGGGQTASHTGTFPTGDAEYAGCLREPRPLRCAA